MAISTATATATASLAQPAPIPTLLQQPALSHDLIALSYAGDIWTVSRTGGKATRLTTGVGIESAPILLSRRPDTGSHRRL